MAYFSGCRGWIVDVGGLGGHETAAGEGGGGVELGAGEHLRNPREREREKSVGSENVMMRRNEEIRLERNGGRFCIISRQ